VRTSYLEKKIHLRIALSNTLSNSRTHLVQYYVNVD